MMDFVSHNIWYYLNNYLLQIVYFLNINNFY